MSFMKLLVLKDLRSKGLSQNGVFAGLRQLLRACLKSFDKRGQEADNRGKTGGG